MNGSFVVDHQQSFMIRCSFCEAMVRKDIPIDQQTIRGLTHDTMKVQLTRDAAEKGWKYLITVHGITLNYCPDDKYKLD